jgi:polar amino acid transport system substrate-binding protein
MRALSILGTALLSLGLVQEAAAQTPCENYTIVSGDTLGGIAGRAGFDNFLVVYRANRGTIGTNPNVIEIGDVLTIPCSDGSINRGGGSSSGTQTASNTRSVAPSEPASAPNTPFQRPIRFVTGSDYAPFTDESLEEGGMFTELVKKSMLRSDESREYSIDFVNDWGSHLSTLLPYNAFDLGFPWFKPDCSKIDKLSDAMRKRCLDFNFSNPFYEVVIGFFTKDGSPYAEAKKPQDIFGARLCRPEGYFTFDLEQEDLISPNITYNTPVQVSACFEGLQDGTYDIVTINVLIAEEEIAKLDSPDDYIELEQLATIQTLHVISPKTNPFGRTYLALLNKGLGDLSESGEWFSIVSRHLANAAQSGG